MKRKILFVITKSNFGGAQKYVFDLATKLPKSDFDVAVIVGGNGSLVDKLLEAHIHVIAIPSLLRNVNPVKDIESFLELLKLFRSEKPDIVHLNSAKVSGLGALAGRLAGVPNIIFTAHGWAFNEERSFLSRIFITFFSWLTVALSHKTIAVSEAVEKDTTHWPFVKGKMITIKNGIKEPSFYPREEARARLFARVNTPTPPTAYVIGTIAELHRNKGLGYLIEAFAKLATENPTYRLFILGGGEEKERLSALLKLRNLEERVSLLGFTENAVQFLPAFDLFVLPSIKEGLPFVILEAGLAKLPVIATDVGGISEVIQNNETGLLVSPRNPQAIFKAVEEIEGDPTRAKRFGETLRARVLRDFSLDRALTETMTLYTK